MKLGGYWQNGLFIQGATVRTNSPFSVGELELRVAAALDRARNTSDALTELRALLQQYPQLRGDPLDQPWNSETGQLDSPQHLLTPLAQLYAEQLMNTTAETRR